MGVLGMVHRAPPTTRLPLRHVSSRVRCFSSPGHITFIQDVAATQPPNHLPQLLKMLQARGDSIVSPGSRQGLIPIAIPLSENLSGSVTALLRWPTAPSGMEMPVVEVQKHGVWLLAKNINRILVEEDANTSESDALLFHASSDVGEKLYRRGDFAESKIANLDAYLLREVGLFPDILECKVRRHFEEEDYLSAMVTGSSIRRRICFQVSDILLYSMQRVSCTSEAKDSARVALKSPWWTLGCAYQEVASIAQWDDEQIEYIKEKVTEEGRQEDLKKGKPPAQIALDGAVFLMDLASIEGTWDDVLERVAECYREGGFDDIARFVLYRLIFIKTAKLKEIYTSPNIEVPYRFLISFSHLWWVPLLRSVIMEAICA